MLLQIRNGLTVACLGRPAKKWCMSSNSREPPHGSHGTQSCTTFQSDSDCLLPPICFDALQLFDVIAIFRVLHTKQTGYCFEIDSSGTHSLHFLVLTHR